MKEKKNILFVFTLVILSTIHSFAAHYTAEESQKRDVKNFSAIEVSTGIDLFISLGNEESLKIEASEQIITNVVSEVKNGTLHIYVKNKSGFNLLNWRNYSSVKAYLTVVELNRLKASAGADVKSENTLKGNTMDLSASSGSKVNIDLVYKDLKLDASSGAKLDVTGRTKNLKVSSSSGGILDAADLESEYCKANASSGGYLSVHAANEIAAWASSGGNIRYSGNPKNKDINKSSGGTVSSR